MYAIQADTQIERDTHTTTTPTQNIVILHKILIIECNRVPGTLRNLSDIVHNRA